MNETVPLLKSNAMIVVFANANAVAAFWPSMYEKFSLQLAVWDKLTIGLGSPLRNAYEYIIVGAVGKSYCSNKSTSTVFRHKPVNHTKRVHQAQKPSSLITELITLFCPENGTVLDPFAGSRVVAIVAEELKRNCVTIEWESLEEQETLNLL